MIKYRTDTPGKLLTEFKTRINQREQKGKIDTWEEYGGGFRHTAHDWKDKGKFIATISEDDQYLIFRMEKFEDSFAFAYYHGHLLQAFIAHLSPHFQFARYVDAREKK